MASTTDAATRGAAAPAPSRVDLTTFAQSAPAVLRQAWRLARRELRGGTRGFRVFLACLALGVTAIAGIQAVSTGILTGLREDGRAILGGDLALRLTFEPATTEQLGWLNRQGTVATVAELRAMARSEIGPETSLVELKAVDGLYPLAGTVQLDQGGALAEALARRDGVWGVVAEPAVLTRLGLAVGDQLGIGNAVFDLRDTIATEPDRLGAGLSLGPRVMIALQALEATGLRRPGSLIEWDHRLDLVGGDPVAVRAAIAATFPDAGWRIRDFRNAAPQLTQFVDRLTLFLTLVGLTALLVGGVGVGNAVRGYLDGKTATIATLKCVGGSGAVVFTAYLLQVLVLTAAGTGIGLVLGALTPLVAGEALKGILPFSHTLTLSPGGLAQATAFGFLTALSFSLWPLGRARDVAPTALFRALIAPPGGRPRPVYQAATGLAAATLAAVTILSAYNPIFAAWFVGGATVAVAVFLGAARLVTGLVGRLPRIRHPGLRLALANLHRPGNATGSVVLSLGLGLTVLVAVALIESNFTRQVRDNLPESAPAFFFVDIQPDQLQPFLHTIAAVPGAGAIEQVPSLRGRIATINGVPAEQALADPEFGWVLRGDRGVTTSAAVPENSTVIEGRWWAEEYGGPPLISVYQNIAKAFAIGVGDHIGINILGRIIEAEIASVRDMNFLSMGLNFTLVFSPGSLAGAPRTHIATVEAEPGAEEVIQRAVAERFANITAVRVKEALQTAERLLADIGLAVRLTAAVALVVGTLVLAGAVAAGQRRRIYDAVVLKVLGATRGDVLRAYLLEFAVLGLITAAVAAVVGSLAAWAVLTQVMSWPWSFSPGAVFGTAAIATLLTVVVGLAGTWRALGHPAAPLLRND